MPVRRISSLAVLSALILASISQSCSEPLDRAGKGDFRPTKGEYLGQKPPGEIPELFAPGIVSTCLFTRDVAMTPDGREIYFSAVLGRYAVTQILFTKNEEGGWTEPEVAPFSGNPEYMDVEPAISPDGKRFYFLSTRPDSAHGITAGGQDIWVMDRIDGGWCDPYNLGAPVNTSAPEFFPSVTRDGTLYFTRGDVSGSSIYRSRCTAGGFSEPEKLPSQVNSTVLQYNAFIAPDESYIIVCAAGRDDCLGGDDYYVCFRSDDDTWSEPVNMGERINTKSGGEHSPYVSPDGKYFFFMSSGRPVAEPSPAGLNRDEMMRMHIEPGNGRASIYWVDAGFIEKLRPGR